MRRSLLIITAAVALAAPAVAEAAYPPTLTIARARHFLEEINEGVEEHHPGVEAEITRCFRVRRLQVDCREKNYVAGEPQYEDIAWVWVTSRNQLRASFHFVRLLE